MASAGVLYCCSAVCGCFVVVVLYAVRMVLGGVRGVVTLRCVWCVQRAEGCVASAGVVYCCSA